MRPLRSSGGVLRPPPSPTLAQHLLQARTRHRRPSSLTHRTLRHSHKLATISASVTASFNPATNSAACFSSAGGAAKGARGAAGAGWSSSGRLQREAILKSRLVVQRADGDEPVACCLLSERPRARAFCLLALLSDCTSPQYRTAAISVALELTYTKECASHPLPSTLRTRLTRCS